MKKKIQLHTMSVLMLFLMSVFCVSISLAAGPKMGGTLRFGTENDFAGFEVLQSSSRLAINGSIAANTIMEPLFRMDDEEHLIPVLGLSAKQSEDGKTWTVNLRENVKFHDGTVFNADAVVHHWNRLLNPENKFRGRAAMGPIVSVTKLDEFTIQYNLKHPWLPFKRVIGSTRGLVQLIPSSKSVESGNQDRAPAGTGPFKLKEWKSGDAFTVVKNPDYWGKDVPILDEIVFKPMTDSQTRYASLQSGQVDVIWMDGATSSTKRKRITRSKFTPVKTTALKSLSSIHRSRHLMTSMCAGRWPMHTTRNARLKWSIKAAFRWFTIPSGASANAAATGIANTIRTRPASCWRDTASRSNSRCCTAVRNGAGTPGRSPSGYSRMLG